MRLSALLILGLLIALHPANASVFEQGARASAAFRCAKLAEIAAAHDLSKIVETSEHDRLFRLGLEEGKKFAEAILSGKYNPREDILDTFEWSLAGAPSADFLVGRLAEFAQRQMLLDLPKKPVTLEWTSESGEAARKLYLDGNCKVHRQF